jgi:demethylmenaquinone methyltransferase/2-methoxy-6-polyprenyl-1,4-benzoquinol methylase
MTNLTGAERARYVKQMFSRIAQHYDLMNRVMTAGQDIRWRRTVIGLAGLPEGGRLLDLGAGTGDLAREALRQQPDAWALAADFTLAMMHAGQRRSPQAVRWSAADALQLPFPDNTFDAIVSGFLLRNVTDLQGALREQLRVLKPGGAWVSLDTTRPGHGLFSPFVLAYLRLGIPFLGWLLTGQRQAYTYLPATTEHFLRAEELAVRLAIAGFQQITFHRLNFGTVAIHWAIKG